MTSLRYTSLAKIDNQILVGVLGFAKKLY